MSGSIAVEAPPPYGPGEPGPQLPVGAVTFLFADVQRSTEALERFGDAYALLLARFRGDSETLVTGDGGTLVQTEGDGVFAAFAEADDALRAAVAAQRTYLAYPPERVREPASTGSATPVT